MIPTIYSFDYSCFIKQKPLSQDEFERCVANFPPNKQDAEYSLHASIDKG
ncbi:hypothetical protein VCHE16_1779 [Vibrio paracholerae HE-16]|nr:hypothetical protein VCHE09_1167 [Vibrio paracholerae HE-09]EKG87039.1 hypothetical protein VCHE16_1779 [Vibrio paracholerae HE-16]EMP93108.1 hypothetical protein VC87395_001382 [Vibrio paracholerae 87395]